MDQNSIDIKGYAVKNSFPFLSPLRRQAVFTCLFPPRHSHGDPTSLAPHERLTDLAVVPREKPHPGAPLENNPEIPPSSRDEGLRLLHGLETNLAASLQTPQEA